SLSVKSSRLGRSPERHGWASGQHQLVPKDAAWQSGMAAASREATEWQKPSSSDHCLKLSLTDANGLRGNMTQFGCQLFVLPCGISGLILDWDKLSAYRRTKPGGQE
ncbi:unnamed protein product, partial [Protopolystoma xenopodis]